MSRQSPLPAVVVGPDGRADASVIWLHGLGADGHDFEPVVPELRLPAGAAVRFIFPHAPARPVTVNGGMSMPAWYDIKGFGAAFEEDAEGIRRSESQIVELIEAEAGHGVAPARIVLAGFSQGGAIAQHTGLRFPERLAGIMALSTYLPLRGLLESERQPANQDVPIFMAHGTADPVVAFGRGEHSRDLLVSLNYSVDWHSYAMPHSVCAEELRDIGRWLTRVLQLE